MEREQPSGLMALVRRIIGVDSGPAFDLSKFFSGVFVRHSEEELDEFFCQGYGVHPEKPVYEWPMPWVFSRVLLFGAVMAVFAFMCGRWSPGNLNIVPLQMFAYSAIIPVGVAVLMFELNVHRSISLITAVKVFVVGGVVAALASDFVYLAFENTAVFRALGNAKAGIVEEPAKLLAVLLFVKTIRRCRSVLEGIALGALIGAGFAVFETTGYYFNTFLVALQKSSGNLIGAISVAESNGLARAWSAPYGHMVFSAIVVGGLFVVKGDRPFSMNMLWDRRFLRIAAIPVLCHMFWDSSFFNTIIEFIIKLAIIAVIEIATLMALVGYGLKMDAKAVEGGSSGRRSEPDPGEGPDDSRQPNKPANAIPVKWIAILALAWLVFDYSKHDCWIWERRSNGVQTSQPTQTQPEPTQTERSEPTKTQPSRPQTSGQQPVSKKTDGKSVIRLKMPHVQLQNGCMRDPYGRYRINRFMTAMITPMPPNGAIMLMPPTASGFGPNVNVLVETTTLSLADYAAQFETARVNEGAVIRGRNADSATASFALLFELAVNGKPVVSYCRVYSDGSACYAVSGVCSRSDWKSYAGKLQDCVNSFTLNGKRGAK